MSPRSARALVALLILAGTSAAHDHWIAPSSFAPEPNARVALHLWVGHPGACEEEPRDPRRFVRFEVLGPDGPRAVPGLDGRAPAGYLAAREPGLHVVAFQSEPAYAPIEPAAYARFLATKGLDDVAAERARRGEELAPGRDRYARCDKALVRAGGGAGTDRTVGLPLELVLEGDPRAWTSGADVVVRLELAGAPLAGRQVELVRLAPPHRTLVARTGADGRARFADVDGAAGPWCAFAVHQRRLAPEADPAADWEGLWASLAFELGSAVEAQTR